MKAQHNVSFVQLQDNPQLDVQVLQTLQNGFTFVCALNEMDIMQSSCLLNIRLEANNSTLVWSKPAWDISNAWISPAIGNNPSCKYIIMLVKSVSESVITWLLLVDYRHFSQSWVISLKVIKL